jgi:hypothetical protein
MDEMLSHHGRHIVPAQLPGTTVLALISFRLITSLCGLLVTKGLLSKEEIRGLYLNAWTNLEPSNDPDIVRARELLKEYTDRL